MKYRDLLRILSDAGSGVLDQDVTIMGDDEFFAVQDIGWSCDGDVADGVLDAGHLYLVVGTGEER